MFDYAGGNRDGLHAPCEISNEATPGGGPRCVLERDGYRVHSVDSPGQRNRASMLLKRMYSWRGYETESSTALQPDPNRITLQVASGSQLFGTLTLGLDSDRGLHADALYRQEIDPFRDRGCRICEVSNFAVEPQYGTKEVLGSLFYVAYVYARIINKSTDAFVEVHPRHALFYVRMLGFRQIAEMRICPRVNAPAVLLHLELSYMDTQIARRHGSRSSKGRSLYPHFPSTAQPPLRLAA